MLEFNAEQLQGLYDAPPATDAPDGYAFEDAFKPKANEPEPAADTLAEPKQQGADGEGKPPKPEGAPERYEFKAPEGVTYDSKVLEAFEASARNSNLSQAQAQQILDKVAPTLAARQSEQIQAIQQGWLESSRSDKEFGGDRLTESLTYARGAMEKYGTPELGNFLEESHLGNHPELVRFMVRVGRQVGDVTASKGPDEPLRGIREMYPSSVAKPHPSSLAGRQQHERQLADTLYNKKGR